MITKFDSLFAGHVDMDDLGYAGKPVNDRSFSDEHLATVFDKTDAIAQLMDRTGYDTFWMAEHHFQLEGYECIPNLLLLGLHLAHLTKNIKIGCAFNIAPMWHPLRLAEDFATVDILTGGRFIFGVGRGYHTREVETFDAPLRDQAANRDLFEEQVDIIFKAFNQRSFSHHGKYYDLPSRGGTLPWLHPGGADPGAAPPEPPGRMLAANPERHSAGSGLHGQARHQGHRRRRSGRRRGHGRGGKGVQRRPGPRRTRDRTG